MELSKRKVKVSNLGSLNTASLFILASKGLTVIDSVNLELLSLDALSPESHSHRTKKGYAKIKEMKQCGAVRKGKLNKEDETAIEKCSRLSLLRLGWIKKP